MKLFNFSSLKTKSEKKLATEYAKAFNHLDTKFIKDLLADDFTYSSQKVFEGINCKNEYLNYLEIKFATIKNSKTNLVCRLAKYRSKHCLALYQVCKGRPTITATLLIDSENGKIIRANMSMIPSINQIQLLDNFPS